MSLVVIACDNRNPNDVSNIGFREIYTNGPKFEVDLISSDNKTVSAHKYVLGVCSDYFFDYLEQFDKGGKITSELILFLQKTLHLHTQQQKINSLFANTQFIWVKISNFALVSVPLPEISGYVLQKVIDLFYLGDVLVAEDVAPHIMKALEFLKVDEIVVRTQAEHAQIRAEQDAVYGKLQFICFYNRWHYFLCKLSIILTSPNNFQFQLISLFDR